MLLLLCPTNTHARLYTRTQTQNTFLYTLFHCVAFVNLVKSDSLYNGQYNYSPAERSHAQKNKKSRRIIYSPFCFSVNRHCLFVCLFVCYRIFSFLDSKYVYCSGGTPQVSLSFLLSFLLSFFLPSFLSFFAMVSWLRWKKNSNLLYKNIGKRFRVFL